MKPITWPWLWHACITISHSTDTDPQSLNPCLVLILTAYLTSEDTFFLLVLVLLEEIVLVVVKSALTQYDFTSHVTLVI